VLVGHDEIGRVFGPVFLLFFMCGSGQRSMFYHIYINVTDRWFFVMVMNEDYINLILCFLVLRRSICGGTIIEWKPTGVVSLTL
jgi:hypothetical protein